MILATDCLLRCVKKKDRDVALSAIDEAWKHGYKAGKQRSTQHQSLLHLKQSQIGQQFKVIKHDALCGIYLLVRNGRVMYVGQSADVCYRLHWHRKTKRTRNWDRVYFVECRREQLLAQELHYIATFMPPWNKAGIPKIAKLARRCEQTGGVR